MIEPLPFFSMPVGLLYSLIAITLWHAPLYAWLLLVSGWAKRAAALWAILPPLALCAIEKIAPTRRKARRPSWASIRNRAPLTWHHLPS